MKPAAVVFDIWYTLISPEDFRPPGTRTIGAIPALLNLEPEPFRAFWQSRRDERLRTPRLVSDIFDEYLRGAGRTLIEDERAAFDSVWASHDQALAARRDNVLEALAALRGRPAIRAALERERT